MKKCPRYQYEHVHHVSLGSERCKTLKISVEKVSRKGEDPSSMPILGKFQTVIKFDGRNFEMRLTALQSLFDSYTNFVNDKCTCKDEFFEA